MPVEELGYYLPTTEIIDITKLTGVLGSPEFRSFVVVLTQLINRQNMSLNARDWGAYPLIEILNHQLFFDASGGTGVNGSQVTRNVFRKVINFGALPNAGTTSVAHNIPFAANYTLTRAYGAATDPVNFYYIPIPYVSNAAAPFTGGSMEMWVDGTNVNINTTGNATAFSICYVILEYLKN